MKLIKLVAGLILFCLLSAPSVAVAGSSGLTMAIMMNAASASHSERNAGVAGVQIPNLSPGEMPKWGVLKSYFSCPNGHAGCFLRHNKFFRLHDGQVVYCSGDQGFVDYLPGKPCRQADDGLIKRLFNQQHDAKVFPLSVIKGGGVAKPSAIVHKKPRLRSRKAKSANSKSRTSSSEASNKP